MSIPNPHNGYIPKVGERVRIIGACHSRYLDKVVKVMGIFDYDGEAWFSSIHTDSNGEVYHSSGLLGGVEPVDQSTPLSVFR